MNTTKNLQEISKEIRTSGDNKVADALMALSACIAARNLNNQIDQCIDDLSATIIQTFMQIKDLNTKQENKFSNQDLSFFNELRINVKENNNGKEE